MEKVKQRLSDEQPQDDGHVANNPRTMVKRIPEESGLARELGRNLAERVREPFLCTTILELVRFKNVDVRVYNNFLGTKFTRW